MGSGGSRSHSHDLTNRNRIQGLGRWVSGQRTVKPVVPKTGPRYIQQERGDRTSAYPGRSVVLPGPWLLDRQRVGRARQKSAEATEYLGELREWPTIQPQGATGVLDATDADSQWHLALP